MFSKRNEYLQAYRNQWESIEELKNCQCFAQHHRVSPLIANRYRLQLFVQKSCLV